MEQFKFFTIQKLPLVYGKKTDTWEVFSVSGSVNLGHIKWYGPWRKYCFYPAQHTIFDGKCLFEMSEILKIKTNNYITKIKKINGTN